MSARASLLVALGGLLVAALGALGVASGEGTRLSFGDFDPWLAVYAVGLFIALGAAPYGLLDRFTDAETDKDARWDRVLAIWGGCAFVAGLLFVAWGAVAGFDPATTSGSLALVGAGACGLVFGTLLLTVLVTG